MYTHHITCQYRNNVDAWRLSTFHLWLFRAFIAAPANPFGGVAEQTSCKKDTENYSTPSAEF